MATVFFSNGDTAEITDAQGRDPRVFTFPATSLKAFDDASKRGNTLQFSEGGEVYLLTKLQLDRGVAVLQVRRR